MSFVFVTFFSSLICCDFFLNVYRGFIELLFILMASVDKISGLIIYLFILSTGYSKLQQFFQASYLANCSASPVGKIIYAIGYSCSFFSLNTT